MLVKECKEKILKNLLGQQYQGMYPTVYMGLSYKAITDDASEFAEPGPSTGYERCAIGVSSSNNMVSVMSINGGTAYNNQMIAFGEAKSGAENYTLKWFGLFTSADTEKDKVPFICGPLDLTPEQQEAGGVVVQAGQIAIFSKGESEQEAAFKVTVTDNSDTPNA